MKSLIALLLIFLPFLPNFLALAKAEVSGNEWRQYDETLQRTYLAGVFDGWSHIIVLEKEMPILFRDGKEMEEYHRARIRDMYGVLVDCAKAKNMTYTQLARIAQKYLNKHPGDWGYGMPSLFRSAMKGICPK